jgi:hypothetical protein
MRLKKRLRTQKSKASLRELGEAVTGRVVYGDEGHRVQQVSVSMCVCVPMCLRDT